MQYFAPRPTIKEDSNDVAINENNLTIKDCDTGMLRQVSFTELYDDITSIRRYFKAGRSTQLITFSTPQMPLTKDDIISTLQKFCDQYQELNPEADLTVRIGMLINESFIDLFTGEGKLTKKQFNSPFELASLIQEPLKSMYARGTIIIFRIESQPSFSWIIIPIFSQKNISAQKIYSGISSRNDKTSIAFQYMTLKSDSVSTLIDYRFDPYGNPKQIQKLLKLENDLQCMFSTFQQTETPRRTRPTTPTKKDQEPIVPIATYMSNWRDFVFHRKPESEHNQIILSIFL